MQPNQKKILIGVIIGLVALAAIVAAYLLGRSGGDSTASTTPTTTTSRTSTTPTEAAPVKTVTVQATTSTPAPAPATTGPYTTEGAAAAHVAAEGDGMQVLDPGATWQPGGTLHVIHATPTGGASYGGDFYYFFVEGYQVGTQIFTSAASSAMLDGSTFAVTFNVYLSMDPHCCPSGGQSTVQFYWDGGSLVTVGSMTGATM